MGQKFRLLYTFKAEVEKTSPGSVVEIDYHKEEYIVEGKRKEKNCFRRAFVCFKACSNGFLTGCRPYLAVDATALNGRWKGQLVAACAVDGHNWHFPVAFGVLEVESEENWTWFFGEIARRYRVPTRIGYTHRCLQGFGDCSRSRVS